MKQSKLFYRPSEKHPTIDDALRKVFGMDRKKSILNKKCAWCRKGIDFFRDALSEKEYTISGFCQECQDEVFN